MLFQMATGELPIRGNFEVQIVHKQVDDAPDPRKLNPRLPRDLATIILKCLERDPNGRYATAAAVSEELRRFLRGEPIHARPLSAGRRVGRWALRKPAQATALALTMILAVAGPLAAVVFFRQRAEIDREYRESLGIIRLEEQQRKVLLDENLALESRIEALLGQAPGIERIAPDWKKNLIAQVVEAHYADAPLRANRAGDLRDQARRALAIGYLYAELDPPAAAVGPLQKAKLALEQLLRESPGDQGAIVALADCLSLIAKHTDDEALAKTSLEQLVALRGSAARDEPSTAAAIDHVDAHWQAFDADGLQKDVVARLGQLVAAGEEIVKNWPADPADAYQAACRLTSREAALSNPEP